MELVEEFKANQTPATATTGTLMAFPEINGMSRESILDS